MNTKPKSLIGDRNMPLDPAREQAAWEIIRNSKIFPKLGPNGRYHPVTKEGTSLTVSEDFADPVEAVERGQVIVQESEQRQLDNRVRRLFDALSYGIYAPWPRDKNGGKEWLVLRTSDRSIVSGPYDGLFRCLVEIAKLIEAGPSQPVSQI